VVFIVGGIVGIMVGIIVGLAEYISRLIIYIIWVIVPMSNPAMGIIIHEKVQHITHIPPQ